MGIPRRAMTNQWCMAERAIHYAKQTVESMPADVRLTKAVTLLSEAQNSVADYIDEKEQGRRAALERRIRNEPDIGSDVPGGGAV